MKKNVLGVTLGGITIAMMLSGCGEFQQIADNVNTLSDQMSGVETQSISNVIDDSKEAVDELTEWYADTSAKTQENAAELSNNIEILKMSDFTAENISRKVADQIAGTVMTEVSAFQERGEKVIASANEKKNEGIEKIANGADKFASVSSEASTASEAVEVTFDSANQIVEGANDVAAAATLILQESIKTAREVIEQAESYGIATEQLDELNISLLELENTEIVFVSSNAENMAELQKEAAALAEAIDKGEKVDYSLDFDPSQVVAQCVEQANQVVDTAENISSSASALYETINLSAQDILERAEEFGVKSKELDVADKYLKQYENMDFGFGFITDKNIDMVKSYLDDIEKQASEIVFEDLLRQFEN